MPGVFKILYDSLVASGASPDQAEALEASKAKFFELTHKLFYDCHGGCENLSEEKKEVCDYLVNRCCCPLSLPFPFGWPLSDLVSLTGPSTATTTRWSLASKPTPSASSTSSRT